MTIQQWGLPRETCWSCLKIHTPGANEDCSQKPCVFCDKYGHWASKCERAPMSKKVFGELMAEKETKAKSA